MFLFQDSKILGRVHIKNWELTLHFSKNLKLRRKYFLIGIFEYHYLTGW